MEFFEKQGLDAALFTEHTSRQQPFVAVGLEVFQEPVDLQSEGLILLQSYLSWGFAGRL